MTTPTNEPVMETRAEFRKQAAGLGLIGGTEYFMYRAGQLEDCHWSKDKDDELRRLRWRLLMDREHGEVYEYRRGEANDDIVEVADGLADIAFVSIGSLITYFGPTLARLILNEVWASNLSKVGDDMFKDEHGKVMKPPSYFAPEIREILAAHGLL